MKKNVILIHTDQQRYDSLGCCGNEFAVTPNIDRFAEDATVFDRHIVANPVCMPSRASLLTGLYPPGHNVYTNGVALNRREYINFNDIHVGNRVVREPETMADMFASSGYATASLGKLHLTPSLSPKEYGYPECWELKQDGSLDDWHGPYYGFDYVDLTSGHGEQPCTGIHYGVWLKENHPELYQKVKDTPPAKPIASMDDLYPSPIPSELHHSSWLAQRFCSYLEDERPKDKPFFTFIGFPDPHHPFTPSYDILEKFNDIDVKPPYDPEGTGLESSPGLKEFASNRSIEHLTEEEQKTVIRYTYAMVHQVDIAVGRILDAVEKAGLMDDTIIAFTSDHGDFLCDHQMLYKCLQGVNSLLHVPFILKAPDANLPKRVSTPMSNCDVMPTLAALAGIDIPENLHGVNIVDIIKNDEEHYAFAFCADGTPESINYTVYDNQYRFTWYPKEGFLELFDHETDPGEAMNIADKPEHAELIESFQNIIKDGLIQFTNPIQGRVGGW